jgi:hypothetical protein
MVKVLARYVYILYVRCRHAQLDVQLLCYDSEFATRRCAASAIYWEALREVGHIHGSHLKFDIHREMILKEKL